MKRLLLLLVLGLSSAAYLAAEKHPLAGELQEELSWNPIEPRVPEMMIYISQKSEELNAEGYDLYLGKRYREAIGKFDDAVAYDDDNSFAWYNMACCYALLDDGYNAAVSLKEAVNRDWYWGLQLMTDTDLDQIRYIGINYEYGEYDYTGEPVFSHILYENGRVDFIDNFEQLYQDGEPKTLGSGYYCIIYAFVFEYFPIIESYWVDGPNGPITIPAQYHAAKIPDISLR